MPTNPLSLRDIYLPEPIGWWPLAVGWWVLFGLILLLFIVVIKWLRYRREQQYSVVSRAQNDLQTIGSEYRQNNDVQYLIRELSAFFRKVCISLFPREQTAGLIGKDWLLFLDQCMSVVDQDKPFSTGIGRLLLEAPYRQQVDIDGEQLLLLCERWISAAQQYAKAQ